MLLGLAQLPLQEIGLKAAFLLHGAGKEQTQCSTGTKEGILCKDFLVKIPSCGFQYGWGGGRNNLGKAETWFSNL